MAEFTKEDFDAAMRRYTEELMRLRPMRNPAERPPAPKPPVQQEVPAPIPPQVQEPTRPVIPPPPPSPIPRPPVQEPVFPAPMPEFPQENRAPVGWNGNGLPPGVVLRSAQPDPLPIPQNPMVRKPEDAPELGSGTLTVTVRTAEEAMPVAGASVLISDDRYGDRRLMASLETDQDGVTPEITLPAPLSAPNVQNVPFAVYTVEISAPGYLPERVMDVAVLSGQGGRLPVSLKPAPFNLVVPEQVAYSQMPEF